jgi:antibiotic biosynthesis monooxygenase (ABM) superfamily enzyme
MTTWRVRPGSEADFLETARSLADVLLRLPHRPGELTLVQSIEDESAFHSIGWFDSQDELEAMRQNVDARSLLERLVALCTEFRPTAHRVVYTTAGARDGAL